MSPEANQAGSAERALRHDLVVNGLALVVYEWPGAGDPVLLVHATGFHARCWGAVIERLPGRHVYAVDMASHGASARRAPPYDWGHFGDDLAALLEVLGLRRTLGVGHSMGGHALVLAAARLPESFRALMLLDPVIVDPEIARGMRISAAEHPISRRRNRWDSAQQMVEVLGVKEPFCAWDPVVLRDYCHFGLVAARDAEGFELACPPDLEAEIYASMRMNDIYAAVASVELPVDIIRARSRRVDESAFSFAPSPTWERLAALFRDARDEQLSDRSHFFPMEIPAWVARRIAAFSDQCP